jgi:hypothetical protein
MSHYTKVLYYFKELLESDPLVVTVTNDEDGMSLNKMDLFMLANIEVNDSPLTNGQTVGFDCVLTVLDIVDDNKEITEDKFFRNNNEVDIYNETHAVINRFWTKLNQDFSSRGIKAPDNGVAEKGRLETKDNAIGWRLPFSIQMPNNKLHLSQ